MDSCTRCGRALLDTEEFCPNCGTHRNDASVPTVYSGAAPPTSNDASVPTVYSGAAPPTSYGAGVRDPYSSDPYAIPPPPPPSPLPPSKSNQRRLGIWLLIIVIIIVIVGVVLYGGIKGLISATNVTSNTSQVTATAQTNVTSPTPTPEAFSVSLSIPCIGSDCSYHPIQLMLTTITLDSTNNQTALTFNVREGCSGTAGTSFQTVELQDPTGNTYKGTVSDNSWTAETIIKVAVFDNFIMQKNVEYLLNVTMLCSIYNDVFKSEYIKV